MQITLASARERKGLTPAELADAAHVHLATIYRLEAGDIHDPSHSTVRKLERALRLPAGSLIFGDEGQR